MKENNIFLIKKFVDKQIPKYMDIIEVEETEDIVQTQKIVKIFSKQIRELEEDDFIEVMISCFIPDTYRDNGRREKLYTKLAEVVVGEWWRRLGGKIVIPTTKSGTEDVELIIEDISIVCDAKIFRLGRSQKAPNVKDFLKSASVKLWIDNLVEKYKKIGKEQRVVGGMVTYSSLHEWKKKSEVYQECTNKEIPIAMLSYEILALLLKKKDNYELKDFIQLWNYDDKFEKATKFKNEYWKEINEFIIALLDISKDEYEELINEYRKEITVSVEKYKSIIEQEIIDYDNEISEKLNSFDSIEDMKEYVKEELSSYFKKQCNDYLNRIDKFRKF